MWILLVANTKAWEIKVQSILHQNGLWIDFIGKDMAYRDLWNIVMRIRPPKREELIKNIKLAKQTQTEICTQILQSSCKHWLKTIDKKIKKIEREISQMETYTIREERKLLDIVGHCYKLFFRVMDSNAADQFYGKLTECKT